MSTDNRELILLRLVAIGEEMRTAALLKTFDRNKLDLQPVDFPQGVLLDGDENADPDEATRTGARGRAVFRKVEMQPQLFLCEKGLSEEAGSKLNALRAAWLKRVLNDDQLTAILGENGYVRYESSLSSFKMGRQLDSTMLVNVSFGYILLPTAL